MEDAQALCESSAIQVATVIRPTNGARCEAHQRARAFARCRDEDSRVRTFRRETSSGQDAEFCRGAIYDSLCSVTASWRLSCLFFRWFPSLMFRPCGPPCTQVEVGPGRFTFDFVYEGSDGYKMALYEECVRSKVDGLYQGYNSTVRDSYFGDLSFIKGVILIFSFGCVHFSRSSLTARLVPARLTPWDPTSHPGAKSPA